MLKNPDAYWDINSAGLKADSFMNHENRRVMQAILDVVADNKEPDQATLIEALEAQGDRDSTITYLDRLMDMSFSTAQAIEGARIVKGLATARGLQHVGAEIIRIAQEKRADSDDAVSEAESLLRRVRDELPVPDRSPDPADILRRLKAHGPKRGIELSFVPSLQNVTGGLMPGHFWVIGGFSSTGKSAVAVNITVDVLKQPNKQVCIISTEMTQEQYIVRMLSHLAQVPQGMIRDRLPGDLETGERIRQAEAFINRTRDRLKVFDTVYRLRDIRTQAKRMKETKGLDVLMVDFIQNVSGDTGDEVKDARQVAIELQLLGKELDCTVIGFSQVSNEMAKYQQEGGDNNYYSWKGSGAIRDASDVSIVLKRDRVRKSPILDWQVVKNRHGELLVFSTTMDLPTGRITECEYEEDDE